jgi:hypothetical protein
VGDRGVVNVDGVVLIEIPEGRTSEGCAQVGDDPVGYTEAMCNVSYEFCRFFSCYFHNRSDFYPLGEFVDGYQYVPVAAWGGAKWSYGVETPHDKGP